MAIYYIYCEEHIKKKSRKFHFVMNRHLLKKWLYYQKKHSWIIKSGGEGNLMESDSILMIFHNIITFIKVLVS